MTNELAFQKHIIDSYKEFGGFAAKWASGWQGGPPDIIAALPMSGLHLVEVKHMNRASTTFEYKNPMTPLQRKWMKDYNSAGSATYLAMVIGEKALGSKLYYISPHVRSFVLKDWPWVPYVPGVKYCIPELMKKATLQ